MRGMGARLSRAAVILTAVASTLVLMVTLCVEVASAKDKDKDRGKSKPDAFEQLKAQTNFDQKSEQKVEQKVEQKRDSDSDERSKSAADKGQDNSDKGDKPGKNSDKNGKDTADSSDEGKDGSPKTSKRDGGGKSASRDKANDDGPPRTVEEWFKGLAQPKQPEAEPGQAIKPGQQAQPVQSGKPVQPVQNVEKAEKADKASPPKPATSIVRDRPLALDAVRAEVLANNLPKESLKLALEQGFALNGKSTLLQMDKTYTKLSAPIGMSAKEATEFLAQLLPGQDIGANEAYRIYKTATSVGVKPAAIEMLPPPVPMATTCGTDRCFAQTLIGWRPQLQACAKSVRIGVIDTGIDQSHPAFKTRRIEARQEPKGRALLKRTVAPKWHGTGVLALLAGDPHSNTPGLISDASFYVADVFYADGDGLPVSDTASILEALNWLAAKQVNIVNMSLTGPHDALLKTAIEDLSRKGMIFVAAVGNDGPAAPPTYPSAYPPVVAVSAINKDYSSYRYANRGDHVDLATPGVDIWTAMPDAQGAYHSGTSFAVPYATAMLASVFSGLTTKTKAEALAKLSYVDLGVPGRDPVYGRGLAIAPYGCEMGPGTPLKLAPQPSTVSVTTVKN